MKTEQWDELAGRMQYVARTKGFGVFTGDTGLGKSTALRRLSDELDKNRYKLLYVCDSYLTPRNFYVETLRQLGYKPRFYRGDTKRQLQKALEELSEAGQIPLIVVDESHMLSHEMLEEVRFLLNSMMDSSSPAGLILMGQSELKTKLRLQIHAAIDGRVNMRFHLGPMTAEETVQYVNRHMSAAGSKRDIFTETALQVMHEYTHGIPRKINNVAIAALMAATSQKKNLIDDYLMREVIASEFEL